MIASWDNHEGIAQILIDNGANVNQESTETFWGKLEGKRTPLILASKRGHKGIAQILIDNGAEVNKAKCWGKTPLIIASKNGHSDVVKILMDNGASFNEAKWQFFWFIAFAIAVFVVGYLLFS
jgi:ankyrin repeat protein